MLNRRTLRIKAMQAIYSYMQAEGSDYLMALDMIEEAFAPDMNSMEPQDRKLLEGKKQIGTILFKEWYQSRELDPEETDPAIIRAVNEAIAFYQKQVKKDFRFFSNQMLSAVEKIYDNYLVTLQILEALAQVIQQEESGRGRRFTEKKEPDSKRFLHNRVLQKLLDNKSYQQLVIRRNISWANDLDVIRQLYRNEIKKDEIFLAYLERENTSFEEDENLVRHLFKHIFFKEKNLQSLFEERDLNWVENKVIVKSMATKTLKLLDEASDDSLAMLDLSANWEDDKVFFEDLYQHTVQEENRYEQMIATSVKNWDVERVALIDKIILKMALCEMHIFTSIPVKVTINEYIEISKIYSTPKSKQFINGVLDKLSQELTASGSIRKSGRGLIDNK
jgi:transcription antitermination protein NusB